MNDIIDARVRLRTERLMRAWTTELNPVFSDYIQLYRMKDRLGVMPTTVLVEQAKAAGVGHMVVCGGNSEENDHILEESRALPAVIPVGGVHLRNGIHGAIVEVERLVESGVRAINLSPFMMKVDVNDRRLYPIYAYCEYKRTPIVVHSSVHFWRDAYLGHNNPMYFDEIAVDFPSLRLIMSHGGNGFGPTVLAVAQRHPNVYLEYSALNPAYMAPEFIHATNTYLSEKCLFGTDYPLAEFKVAIERWMEALRPDVYEKFFRDNAARAFGLTLQGNKP